MTDPEALLSPSPHAAQGLTKGPGPKPEVQLERALRAAAPALTHTWLSVMHWGYRSFPCSPKGTSSLPYPNQFLRHLRLR